jgi:hypothetical protein
MTPPGVADFFNKMGDLTLVGPILFLFVLAASTLATLALAIIEGWEAMKARPSPEYKAAKREICLDIDLYRKGVFGLAELTRRNGQTLWDLEKRMAFGSERHREVEALLTEIRAFHGVQTQSEALAAKLDLDDG